MTATLHLIGLPHTNTTREHTVCAFTQKLVKFAEMMSDHGWPIIVYSGEDNEAPCVEHVRLFKREEQRRWYGGDLDQNVLPTKAVWNPDDECWRTMNRRAVARIRERAGPRDLVLILGGRAQKSVAECLPELVSCEWAAGYSGIFSPFVCFESYAWRHHLYGKTPWIEGGRWFDTVIPNFFRPYDFSLAETKDDYLLFVGRLIRNKGIEVALDVARASGRRLVYAGAGAAEWGPGFLKTFDGCQLEGDLEYVGPVGAEERNELMGRAHALLCPTTYIEPFGAVAVEAQLCGTPVLATGWGAFTENVVQDVTGFNFRTLQEGVDAVQFAAQLEPAAIRAHALGRYSLDACAPLYEEWFARIQTVWDNGWYQLRSSVSASC